MFNFGLEGDFISYLRIYGNTKESYLIEYGTRISMVLEGKANRVFHHKLCPEVAYLTRENCCLNELASEIEAEARDLKDKNKTPEEAGRILREAAALAEKRSRKKFPDTG